MVKRNASFGFFRARTYRIKSIAYSMTCSVLKKTKFTTSFEDTSTLSLLDKRKISIIHTIAGIQCISFIEVVLLLVS